MNDSNNAGDAEKLTEQFDQLTLACGFVRLSDRSFVSLAGQDRQTFLNNFCTNDTKKLAIGEVCEAFVLNGKGKLLGYVHAIADNEELLLTGHGAQAETLIEHLDKYVIREDVQMSDQTESLASIFVCGGQTVDRLSQICGQLPEVNHFSEHELDSVKFRLVHAEFAGDGYLLICDSSSIEALAAGLAKADVSECSPAALEIVRVEAKTPWFGIDADDSNLPQELQRDDKAISFNKGCYLGQETVARIDARGRVNQLLVGLKSDLNGSLAVGEVLVDEKPAGRISSIAQLPSSDSQQTQHIAIGYVRRQFKEPGTKLGDWVVV